MDPQLIGLWLNSVGLVLNTEGAVVLYFFGVQPLRVTASGEAEITLVNSPAPEERVRNTRRYAAARRWSRGGLLALIFGFSLQLIGAVWPPACLWLSLC